MKFKLKPIHADAIPIALEKAERYRLLNEPAQAESICLDILAVDAFHQEALVTLLLAITDQFGDGVGARRAKEILPRLEREYDREYYAAGGLSAERAGIRNSCIDAAAVWVAGGDGHESGGPGAGFGLDAGFLGVVRGDGSDALSAGGDADGVRIPRVAGGT